jgi:GNAT superfamily N-acetyltransferase
MSGTRAEVAISVERRFQGRGIGQALIGHMLIFARNRRFTALEFRCMAGNQRMRSLVSKFDAVTDIDLMEAEAVIEALPPTPATYGIEMIEHAEAFGSSVVRLWLENAGRHWPGRCWSTPDLFHDLAAAGDETSAA